MILELKIIEKHIKDLSNKKKELFDSIDNSSSQESIVLSFNLNSLESQIKILNTIKKEILENYL